MGVLKKQPTIAPLKEKVATIIGNPTTAEGPIGQLKMIAKATERRNQVDSRAAEARRATTTVAPCEPSLRQVGNYSIWQYNPMAKQPHESNTRAFVIRK